MNTMSCEKHLGMGTVQNCAPCLQVELDYVRSENEALRADVVWAVKHGAMEDECSRLVLTWFVDEDYYSAQHDGTDADILRAVREAREGGVMGVNSLVGVPCEKRLEAAESRIGDLLAARMMDDEQFGKDKKRIEELERMVVWAVLHGAAFEVDRIWWFRMLGEDTGDVDTPCDGTDADILRAVREARTK